VRGFRESHHAGPGHELFTSRNVLGRGIVTADGSASADGVAPAPGPTCADDADDIVGEETIAGTHPDE
jgi:hypothetical protein